jgi:hypothetical protein
MLGRCQGFHCTRRVLEIATPRIGGLAALAEDPEARR